MLKWVGAISGCNVTAINVGTFTSRVRAVQTRRARLLKDKATDNLNALLLQPFKMRVCDLFHASPYLAARKVYHCLFSFILIMNIHGF